MFLVLVGELQGLERIDCSTGVNIAQAPAKLFVKFYHSFAPIGVFVGQLG